ncbi:molybdopterin-dependent oxidoreductase [bacterium]|nr:molybdopterin-dependent oxidoreductase [bacterium]
MSDSSLIGKPIRRLDAVSKASGQHLYPSDFAAEGMLYLKVLRAKHPHAEIVSINTEAARNLPGVVRVLTAADIPGTNGYGLVVPHQPVLCDKKARHAGDAIAIVAAETEQLARQACQLIEVTYTILPLLVDPETALLPEAPKLHDEGNLCAEINLGHGDIDRGFADADLVFDTIYRTGAQEHAFLETEAGGAYYDEKGVLTVIAGGQNPFNDHRQIAPVLNLENDRLRVINPPPGGAFGGKEDISVQIFLALATYHTRRPCKMVLSREESIACGTKRHPTRFAIKTGVTRDGMLTAARISILSDAGAYMALSGAVLGQSAEHCCGPYHFPHTEINARAVYTNNGNSSAFRGFGNPQAAFAIELQMDAMADALGMDKLAFRRKNVITPETETGIGHGHRVTSRMSINQVLDAVEKGPLYQQHRIGEYRQSNQTPWIKTGIGVSTIWQGYGIGANLNDNATARVELLANGRYHLTVSCPDLGQGNTTALTQIAAHELNCGMAQIDITIGDTAGPNSGSSNASRTTCFVGSAVIGAVGELKRKILERAAVDANPADPMNLTGDAFFLKGEWIPRDQFAAAHGPISAEYEYSPRQTDAIVIGIPHYHYGYGAQAIKVDVDTLTGEITVQEIENYLDAGKVINPSAAEGQAEGGLVQGLGYALYEKLMRKEGVVINPRLSTYIIPSIMDVPAKLRTILLEEAEPLGPYGARGIGEITLTPVAPAILDAVYDAIGVRFSSIPLTPEMILNALATQQDSE